MNDSKLKPDVMYRYNCNNSGEYFANVSNSWFTNSCGGCYVTHGDMIRHYGSDMRKANTRGACFAIGEYESSGAGQDDEHFQVVDTKNGKLSVHLLLKRG